jgi:hypothetical protein
MPSGASTSFNYVVLGKPFYRVINMYTLTTFQYDFNQNG